jgi:uncharacterized protein YbbC (DUF1343 family)
MEQVQLAILEALLRLYPDFNIFNRAKPDRINNFDKAVGTDEIRRSLVNQVPVDEILNRINQERALFMIKREKYLIYE